LIRNSQALTTPPARLASTAGIIQYRPPPALRRKVSPARPTSADVTAFGEDRSMYRATPLSASCPARRSNTSKAVPDRAARTSSSAPRAGSGWGATSTIAASAEVMNRTRVWAAREARLRDRARVSLLIDTATNSRPVSAPASPATVTPKSRHISGA
jgi:hypothetical protein